MNEENEKEMIKALKDIAHHLEEISRCVDTDNYGNYFLRVYSREEAEG
jgi:hypothetical protein